MLPEHRVSAAELLRRQHEELHEQLSRLELLEGAAHDDVFLLFRRRLAVHVALERLAVPGSGSALLAAVTDAENVGPGGSRGRAATGRILRAYRVHVQEAQQRSRADALAPAVVALAEDLWHGGGETYLGTTVATMLEHATAELRRAADPVETAWPTAEGAQHGAAPPRVRDR